MAEPAISTQEGTVCQIEERQAITRLQQGDISGLETLVRLYQVQAIRTAYLITRDPALAQDIVQTVFLRTYERISQFDARRSFGPWFLKAVANEAIKAARRRERYVSLDRLTERETDALHMLSSAVERGLGERAEQADLHQAVWAALGHLSPSQRAVVVQRYFLGMTEAEIAKYHGHSLGTVKSRLHVVRRRLRQLLHLQVAGAPADQRDRR